MFNDFRILWSCLDSEKHLYICFSFIFAAFVSMVEGVAIGSVVPLVSIVMDPTALASLEIFGNEFSLLLNKISLDPLIAICIIVSAIFIVKCVLVSLWFWFLSRQVYQIRSAVIDKLLSKYVHQGYTEFSSKNSSFAVQNLTTETQFLVGNILLPIMTLVSETLVLLVIVGILFYVAPSVTMVTMIALVLCAFTFTAVYQSILLELGGKRHASEQLRIQSLKELFDNFIYVRVSGTEQYFLDRHKHLFDIVTNSEHWRTFLQQMPRLWLELAAVGLVVFMILYSKSMNYSSSEIVATLSLMAAVLFRSLPSITRLIAAHQALRFFRPMFLDLMAEIQNSVPRKLLANKAVGFNKTFSLKNVQFSYETERNTQPVLSDLCFEINKGERVAIFGESGSGKTTMLNLISGLIEPTHGDILLDGRPLEKNNQKLLGIAAIVGQQLSFVDGSITSNVAFGIEENCVDLDRVKECVKSASLEEFVQQQYLGLDTVIGEGGVALSGGQRQRLSIARALYADKEILLFDEFTSALDSKTEAELIKSLTNLPKDKTVISISHRSSIRKYVDRCYIMQNGRLNPSA